MGIPSARVYPAFLVFAVVALASACSDLQTLCTTESRPAIRATISDSVTGKSAVYGASLVVANASTYDSTIFNEDLGLLPSSDNLPPSTRVVNGSAGTYTVRVRRAGYQLWQRTGVVVDGDECGRPISQPQISVKLQPAS